MKIIYLFLLFPMGLFGQNTICLPNIVNYTAQEYKAGLQNWEVKQDKNGIIYVANNEGLLTFDGKNWELYPLPNKTIVRSVAFGQDNKVYVGGQDELGYFSANSNGVLQYTSLTPLLPTKDRAFEDVWDIVFYNNSMFIRTNYKIFKLTGNQFEVFNAVGEWAFIGVANNKLYAQDYYTGLSTFYNGSWVNAAIKNILPTNDPVTSIIGLGNENAILTTQSNGIFSLNNNGLSKLKSTNNTIFENEKIYSALPLDNNKIALATTNAGAIIIDYSGNILQTFSKKEGLQNNNILSMLLDNEQNLWLGLNNGIDLVAYNSAIKKINPFEQDGSGYTAILYSNKLYLGTTNGLYSVQIPFVDNLDNTKAYFDKVVGAKEQTWGLANINNKLLLANSLGAFEITNNKAYPISLATGYWNFIPLSTNYPSNKMIAGNYKNAQIFDFTNNQFLPGAKIEGLNESARFLVVDKNENIWISHPYHGLYKLTKTGSQNYTIEKFTEKQGLPSLLNNHVFKLKNEMVVATEKGIYTFNEAGKRFEISPYYEKILGNKSIRYLKEDEQGNVWFIHEKSVGVIDYSNKQPIIVSIPELGNKMLSGFEFIYPLNEKNIFMGGEKGFYHIDYEKYKQTTSNLQVQIRKVKTTGNEDAVLFGGFYENIKEKKNQEKDEVITLSKHTKSIQFQFAAPKYGGLSSLQYSYRLKGYDDNWADWADKTEKEYNNLPRGTFNFEVKVRNNLGKESEIATYTFKVAAVWYQSLLARICYFIIFLGLVSFFYKWQQNKFDKQKIKFKEKQIRLEEEKQRLLNIHELEITKTAAKLAALKNEKLEAEINFKNAELASSAMHLVKKGELLSKSKTNLANVMKDMDNPQAVTELKKMIKSLHEDDKMDKEWETFSKHFDSVHSDFLKDLKNIHPSITGNEMKLCAYLRMNLSTKEIAQLLNISARGVEIGRYRLRKKLQLPTETSLFDYLIKIKREK